MTVIQGNRFELLCGGISYPVFNVTWYKNSELYTSLTSVYTDASRSNRTAALIFTSANTTDDGFYQCVLTNSLGSVTSTAIWINILCKYCALYTSKFILIRITNWQSNATRC